MPSDTSSRVVQDISMGNLVEAERDLRGGRVKLKLGDRWDNHTRRVEMLPAKEEYKEHTRGLDL